MSRKLFPVLLVFVLLFTSCGSNAIYDKNVSFEHNKWYKDEAAHFEVDISDTLTDYRFSLNLRNNNDYRFSNLFLFLTTKFPNGNITRDTIECILADNTGKWIGKGWGNTRENDIILKEALRFPLKGKYEFWIQQAMRVDTLKGIDNVGLRLERVSG